MMMMMMMLIWCSWEFGAIKIMQKISYYNKARADTIQTYIHIFYYQTQKTFLFTKYILCEDLTSPYETNIANF